MSMWIIAGNYRTAKEHAREHALGVEGRDWRYLGEWQSLRGHSGPVELVEAHGANGRSDYEELRAYVAALNAHGVADIPEGEK